MLLLKPISEQQTSSRVLRITILFLLSVIPALLAPQERKIRPLWTVDLTQRGLRPFTPDVMRPWTGQQDVVFLNPRQIAVYQVNESVTPAPLGPRGPSGGAGNFHLDVKLFDAQDGHLIRTLRFPTNADLSGVYATRNDQWILRTGDVMYAVSANGQIVASKELVREHDAPYERWQVEVSPSGDEVIAVHQRVFSMPEPATGHEGDAQVEVEALSPTTLQTLRRFSLSRPLLEWSAGDGFLVSPDPNKPSLEARRGILDFNGKWSVFSPPGESCHYEISPLRHFVAAYGCGRFTLFSPAGRLQFSARMDSDDVVTDLSGGEEFVAAQVARPIATSLPHVSSLIAVNRPVRIEVYSLLDSSLRFSIPVHGENVYYALSSQGLLAVVQGGELSMYALLEKN